jgi:beta-phosphoglucomutase-like phosphatase (HAD superfamily)
VLADSEPLHLKAWQALLEPRGFISIRKRAERYFDDEGADADRGRQRTDPRRRGSDAHRREGHVFEALVGSAFCIRGGRLRAALAAAWRFVASGALRADIDLIVRGAGQDLFAFIVAAGDATARSRRIPTCARRSCWRGAGGGVAIEDSHWAWSLRAGRHADDRDPHTYPRDSFTGRRHVVVRLPS